MSSSNLYALYRSVPVRFFFKDTLKWERFSNAAYPMSVWRVQYPNGLPKGYRLLNVLS